jgi:nitrite reductase/ring-hydroxylating ferredoxin subunit
VSPALAFIGISILGTWGLASIGLMAGGIILFFFPGDAATASDPQVGGIVIFLVGAASMGLCMLTVAPLLGLDPPIRIPAKSIIPHSRMKRWHNAGPLRGFPDGKPKEVRMRTQRVLVVRMGDEAYAMNALCSHARLPMGGLPGSPIKAYPVRDGCVTCPFHGARFEAASGRVVRQPFDSQFNNEHPFLGRLQSKLFFFNKKAEDTQTYPVRIENGDVVVGLPK